MFIDTADKNYVLARQAAHWNYGLDFFWLSSQALEKYLKALILLSGGSVRDQSHSLTSLLERAHSADPSLLIEEVQKPAAFKGRWIRDKSQKAALKRIESNGHPDNRYLQIGYNFQAPLDICLVDLLVKRFRGMCGKLLGEPGPFGHLDDLIMNQSATAPARALAEHNLAFSAEAAYAAERWSFTNSPFVTLFEHLNSPDETQSAMAADAIDWMIVSLRLSKSDQTALREAAGNARLIQHMPQ